MLHVLLAFPHPCALLVLHPECYHTNTGSHKPEKPGRGLHSCARALMKFWTCRFSATLPLLSASAAETVWNLNYVTTNSARSVTLQSPFFSCVRADRVVARRSKSSWRMLVCDPQTENRECMPCYLVVTSYLVVSDKQQSEQATLVCNLAVPIATVEAGLAAK